LQLITAIQKSRTNYSIAVEEATYLSLSPVLMMAWGQQKYKPGEWMSTKKKKKKKGKKRELKWDIL